MMRQVILNFHGIGTPARPLEDGEAPYWISQDFYAEILALSHRLRDDVHTHITFDDGNLSDLEIGAALLEPYRIDAQIFVLSARLGQTGSLSPEDLRTLIKMGHSIGLHGADHVDWRRLDNAGQVREFDTARRTIEDAIGKPVTAAAIPFGAYDKSVLHALRHYNFDRVYSSDGGPWRTRQHPIPRTSPRADMTMIQIEDLLLGREPFKRRLRRRAAMIKKRWM